MNNREIKSNEANKGQPQTRSLPDELSNIVFMIAEHKHRNNGKINIHEGLQYLNRYIKLLGKYIEDKDTKNALIVQALFDHACYNLGLVQPFCLQWAARKGGRADKTKKGIRIAIENHLSTEKLITPLHLWKHFKLSHNNEQNAFETPDLNYTVWFYEEVTDRRTTGGYLTQKSFDGKELSIRFKTFERYIYKIKQKLILPQA